MVKKDVKKDILNSSFIHDAPTNPQHHKSELHWLVVTSFHQNTTTKHNMSDNGEWLEHHYGDTLEDQYDDELPDTESVGEMKEISFVLKERLTHRYVSSAALN